VNATLYLLPISPTCKDLLIISKGNIWSKIPVSYVLNRISAPGQAISSELDNGTEQDQIIHMPRREVNRWRGKMCRLDAKHQVIRQV
jgi:hypothetical protein